MEFRFGDCTFMPGDFVSIQTVEQNCYKGFIQSISTRLIGDATVQTIELVTVNGGAVVTTNEIEFVEGVL